MTKETAEQKLLKMMQKSSGSAAVVPAKKKFAVTFTMRALNQFLLLGLIICAAGLFYEMRSGMSMVAKEVSITDDAKSSNSVAQIALPSNQDAKYYLDKISSRNIFRPQDQQGAKVSGGPKGLAARLSKYKLVGVAWLDLPETATIMVEDPATKATSFLKKGEQLEGVTVKTIYTDRAVFSYENEETTIKL